MADQIVDLNNLGEDAVKGGVFFGSSLTPLGSFSNVPNYYTYNPTQDTEATVKLTLKKIKDSLKLQLQNEYSYTENDLNANDETVEKFLFEFTTLLIDYRDLRNYVFFGSAHTEVAHNINVLIATYPYKTLIADLTAAFNDITFINDNAKNQTSILFDESTIKDQGRFSFYDSDPLFNWMNYDIVDKNNKTYKIVKAITPYDGPSISSITNIQNGLSGIEITTGTPHNILNNQTIDIYEVNGILLPNNTQINANGRFVTKNVTATTFEIVDQYTQTGEIMNFTYTSGGKVRKVPLDLNQRPYTFKVIVEGILTFDQLITYTEIETNDNYSGFIISPKQNTLNDFELNLTPIQKILLAPQPINSTPWPRRQITNNLENRINQPDPLNDDQDFLLWLKDPNLLYIKDGGAIDDDIAYSDVYTEYNIVRAQSLDETTTNQLIRRCIPYNIISELNDPDDGYFQRFILVAGWFFDQIWVYIKFIKYVHTLNYGDFNQLSPEYYKLYAEQYGFDLFSDDSIDFSKLVVSTEPGLVYALNQNLDINNKYFRYTVQKLQYERQKRLLLSLFYLYRIKGTQKCIQTLVALLGAPEGLLLLQEYAYKYTNTNAQDYVTNGNYDKTLIVDNDKVHMPNYHFEIDPDFLVDKININNPSNQPYVYRMRLHNESTINLRQLGISTDPAQAIDNHVISIFGNQLYDYVKFNNGEFANLQNLNNPYYLLPLTFPDKYFGFSINYNITRDGYIKGKANNLEECAIHLSSLVLTNAASYKPSSLITDIVLSSGDNEATITTQNNHSFVVNEKIKISNVVGITGINGVFLITEVPSSTTLTIIGDFSGSYISGGLVETTTPNKLTSGFNTTFLLPEVFANYDEDTILNSGGKNPITDFNQLQRWYPDSIFLNETQTQYIFVRLEGKDLVVRLKFASEINSVVVERVAIFRNIFEDDGLNHNLRLLFRPEGIEVYRDYTFKGIAQWRSPITSNTGIPYLAFEIPKKDILTCQKLPIPISDLIALSTNTNQDKIRFWDLFVGLPYNIDMYIMKVEVFENTGIDDYNIGDRIISENNENADSYVFDFKQTVLTGNEFTTDCQFFKANPTNANVDYSWTLPPKQNSNNVTVVDSLTLTSKSFNPSGSSKKFYPDQKQDFFKDKNVFERYGWQPDIHKAYEYVNFNGKVLDLYNLYSPQVLTYKSLLDFLGLIEDKFKRTIQQFIPIVINISEFGRLIKPSLFDQPKVRYPGIHKLCIAEKVTSNANIQSKIFDEETTALTTTTTTTTTTVGPTTTSTTITSTSTTTTTTTVAPILIWVEDTSTCEQVTPFTLDTTISVLSSPQGLFYDETLDRFYVVDLDDINGNLWYFDPSTFTSAAGRTFVPGTNVTGQYIQSYDHSNSLRKIFMTGPGNGGVLVHNIATGINSTILQGSNGSFARIFTRLLNGILYVANIIDNTLALIDPVAETVSSVINVGTLPGNTSNQYFNNSYNIISVNGELWVCAGSYRATNGSIARYDATLTTFIGELTIPFVTPPTLGGGWVGGFWQAQFYDQVNNRFYLTDVGSKKITVIDTSNPSVPTIVEQIDIVNLEGKNYAFVSWELNSITGELYANSTAINSPSDGLPKIKFYKTNRLTYVYEGVYPNMTTANLKTRLGTNELWSASAGIPGWAGVAGWNTDGKVFKYIQ